MPHTNFARPLSVIRGIGELGLRETRTPAEYKEAIGSMLEEVDRLTRLVDTLLQLSRGDAGTVRLSRDVVDLGDLARDVVSSLGLLAEERRQRLDVAATATFVSSADRLVLRDADDEPRRQRDQVRPEGFDDQVNIDGGREHATLTVADEGAGYSAGAPRSHLRSLLPDR